ncbi:GerAB/ArcD/ProY family transporter [Priestia megaterium]|nr:GerAB/ArcD/ProY family transporter [Priestia megaterium]
MQQIKLSGIQLFWIIFILQNALTFLLGITQAIKEANQDAWISILIAGAAALIMAWIYIHIGLNFPNLTLVEICQRLLGKWLGKIIVLPFFIKWIILIGGDLRNSSDFTQLLLFDRTPLWVLIILLLGLTVYVNYQHGVESIGRCSEIIGPMLLVIILIIFIFSFTSMDIHRLFPIYADSGTMAIFKGSFTPMSLLGESVIVLMLIPFMTKPEEAKKGIIFATIISTVLITLGVIAVILTFTPELANSMRYPFFTLSGFISLMEFIQNLDAVVVIIWFFSVFIKIALYVFITSYGLSQLLGIKNWRKIMWVIAVIGYILSLVFHNVNDATLGFLRIYKVNIDLPLTDIGIPIVLLVMLYIKKRWKRIGVNRV